MTDPPTSFAAARSQFSGGRGYLAACTLGLPPRGTVAAVTADLERSAAGHPDMTAASRAVEDSRAAYARLVNVNVDDVALASQTSVMVSLIAASIPDGAVVLCPEGDFASVVLPFVHAGRGIRVRTAPLAELAAAIDASVWMVAFSLVQSATGDIADAAAIRAAAAAAGTRTLCDLTQAAGWLPVDAGQFDVTVCHAYKWLCSPRGVAFLTIRPQMRAQVRPVQAGWYAGDDPWASCYGGEATLAPAARRFDVSPPWQAFVGAAPALDLFASVDPVDLRTHAVGLAVAFREGRGLAAPAADSAIVTWPDPDGDDLERMRAAGIVASGRAGRARVAFHLFNDEDDVASALRALSS